MENTVSIPESRYIELVEIEKKYKASNFKNNDEIYALYIELNSIINAGLFISNDTDNPGNDSIWRRIYDKVLSLCAQWRELVPDFYWNDPDGSYYEDVMAFYHAVKDYVIKNNIISKRIFRDSLEHLKF